MIRNCASDASVAGRLLTQRYLGIGLDGCQILAAEWASALGSAESGLACRLGCRPAAGMGSSKILSVDLVAKAALDGELERILELGVTVEHTIEAAGIEAEITHRRSADGGRRRRVAGRDTNLADEVAGLALGDLLLVDHDLDQAPRDETKLGHDLA